MVRDFCGRDISFEGDSLPAISGTAKEVGKHTGHDYRAGIWMQDIHNGLLWYVEGRRSYQLAYIAPS